ncbi:MAG: exosortase C-terminal domain/associated protein EpsI [Gammaproteobacteria bacterium]
MTQTNFKTVAVFFLIIISIFLIAYRETVQYLLNDWMQWEHGAYAHGFAVLAISLYMIWGWRDEIKQIHLKPSLLASILLIPLSLLWVASIYLGVRFVENISFFLLIPMFVYALAGRELLTRLWFPIVFLLVAFPVWELFLPYLQMVAAVASHFLVKLTGTAILREGVYLLVPAGKFFVAEGCSGLRYLLAAMTFGGFYIYLEGLTKWRAIYFFAVVVSAALLSNALRISAVVIAGNLTEMQHPWVHDHLTLGWYIFAGMLIPVFLIGNKFSNAEQNAKANISKQSIRTSIKPNDESIISYKIILPIIIMALLIGPLIKLSVNNNGLVTNSEDHLSAPEGNGSWEKTLDYLEIFKPLRPEYNGADYIIDQNYQADLSRVRLYIASYKFQKQDKELINVNNYLYSEELWQESTRQTLTIDQVANAKKNKILEYQLKNSAGEEKLIWYWYRSAGKTTTRPIISKILDLYGLFSGNTVSSVIMISADITDGYVHASNQLRDFYSSMINAINTNLDKVD